MKFAKRWSVLVLVLAVGPVGCGDDDGMDAGVDAHDPGDAGPDVRADVGFDAGRDTGGETTPTITGTRPTSVAQGAPLVIEGTALMGATAVTLGGTTQVFTVTSDVEVAVAAVDAETGTQALVVTTPGGAAEASLEVLVPLDILGASARSETSVVLTFNRAVDVASAAASAFTIDGLDVTAATTDGASVTLTTSAMTGGASYALTGSDLSDSFGNAVPEVAAVFTGFEVMSPVITGVTPATAVVGHTALVIAGMNLDGATVTVGGEAQTSSSASATEVTTAALVATTPLGTQPVVVTTAGGASDSFDVEVLAPFRIVSAEATSETTLTVITNRPAAASSVSAARFSIPALSVTDASASGTTITLTTAAQTRGAAYSVGADTDLVDANGAPVTAAFASFAGYTPPVPTDFVVVRLGDGTTVLDATAAPVFLERRLVADGSVDATAAIRTTASGADHAFALPGAGFGQSFLGTLSRSPSGEMLTVFGYDSAPGLDLVAGPRVAAVITADDFIDATGVDTSTTFDTAFSSTVPRGAVTDGTNVWAVGGFGGLYVTPLGSTAAPTRVTTAPSSGRAVAIFEGQLFYSSSDATSGMLLSAVGTGMPTTDSATTPMFATDTPSPASFVVLDLDATEPGYDTVYQADKSNGVLRFEKSGGTWALGATFAPAVLGVACFEDGDDIVCVASDRTNVYTFTDVGGSGAGATMTTLVTADTNTEFRGVSLSPSGS